MIKDVRRANYERINQMLSEKLVLCQISVLFTFFFLKFGVCHLYYF